MKISFIHNQYTMDKQPQEPVMCWWTKPKLGRKKKKETPEMRFQKETKEYSEAKNLKVWKTERRFADEYTLALERLGIKYKLDRLTKFGPNSLFVATLQQLRQPEIFEKLSEENKKLANRMGPLLFRKKVIDFITSSDHPKVQDMKTEFGKRKSKISWDKFWDEGRKKGNRTTIWYVEATALFLNIEILLVQISDMTDCPYFLTSFSGLDDSLQSKDLEAGPITLCDKNCFHYQSILVKDGCDKLKKEDFEDYEQNLYLSPRHEAESICPNCGKSFKRLLTHISMPKSPCHGNVSDAFIQELKDKAAKQHKRSKANSKRKIQTHETLNARKNRLAMQSYYMEKLREKKRAAQEKQKKEETIVKPEGEKEVPKKPRRSCADIILDALNKRRKLEQDGTKDQGTDSQYMVQSMTELQ